MRRAIRAAAASVRCHCSDHFLFWKVSHDEVSRGVRTVVVTRAVVAEWASCLTRWQVWHAPLLQVINQRCKPNHVTYRHCTTSALAHRVQCAPWDTNECARSSWSQVWSARCWVPVWSNTARCCPSACSSGPQCRAANMSDGQLQVSTDRAAHSTHCHCPANCPHWAGTDPLQQNE